MIKCYVTYSEWMKIRDALPLPLVLKAQLQAIHYRQQHPDDPAMVGAYGLIGDTLYISQAEYDGRSD